MGDPTITTDRVGEDRPISNPDDRARVDALACMVAARLGLCNEDELRMFDAILDQLEDERDDSEQRTPVVERLRNDRFRDGDGHDAIDMAYRRGWNAGSRVAEAIVRAEAKR